MQEGKVLLVKLGAAPIARENTVLGCCKWAISIDNNNSDSGTKVKGVCRGKMVTCKCKNRGGRIYRKIVWPS